MNGLITKPKRLHRLGLVLRVYQRSGLQAICRRLGLLRLLRLARLDSFLPPIRPFNFDQEYFPATGAKERGTVALFTGCLGPVCDNETLTAGIHLLNRLGYRVWVPDNQSCCGALHQHGGNPTEAKALLAKNRAIFRSNRIDAIISIASGCSAMLMEHADPNLTASAGNPGQRYMDIQQFLCEVDWPQDLVLEALNQRVAVHEPCTQRNILQQSALTYQLLAKIPQLQIDPLPENSQCCGAAGTYFLTQAEMAHALLTDKVNQIRQAKPDKIITSNLGCAIQLSAGVRRAGLDIAVIHPIVLLNQQSRS